MAEDIFDSDQLHPAPVEDCITLSIGLRTMITQSRQVAKRVRETS
jgi:hypothetical protein